MVCKLLADEQGSQLSDTCSYAGNGCVETDYQRIFFLSLFLFYWASFLHAFLYFSLSLCLSGVQIIFSASPLFPQADTSTNSHEHFLSRPSQFITISNPPIWLHVNENSSLTKLRLKPEFETPSGYMSRQTDRKLLVHAEAATPDSTWTQFLSPFEISWCIRSKYHQVRKPCTKVTRNKLTRPNLSRFCTVSCGHVTLTGRGLDGHFMWFASCDIFWKVSFILLVQWKLPYSLLKSEVAVIFWNKKCRDHQASSHELNDTNILLPTLQRAFKYHNFDTSRHY